MTEIPFDDRMMPDAGLPPAAPQTAPWPPPPDGPDGPPLNVTHTAPGGAPAQPYTSVNLGGQPAAPFASGPGPQQPGGPHFAPPPPVAGLGDPSATYGGMSTGVPDRPVGRLVTPEPRQSSTDAAAGAAPTESDSDLGTIRPRPEVITLESGRQVQVKKLKTWELLGLVDIVIGGVGRELFNIKLDMDEPEEIFAAKFAGLLITSAIGNRDQTIAWVRDVVEPVGLVKGMRLDKAQKARNQKLIDELDYEMENPEPDDTITIIESLARTEGGDLHRWGKRLAGIFRMVAASGRLPASLLSQG